MKSFSYANLTQEEAQRRGRFVVATVIAEKRLDEFEPEDVCALFDSFFGFDGRGGGRPLTVENVDFFLKHYTVGSEIAFRQDAEFWQQSLLEHVEYSGLMGRYVACLQNLYGVCEDYGTGFSNWEFAQRAREYIREFCELQLRLLRLFKDVIDELADDSLAPFYAARELQADLKDWLAEAANNELHY